MNVKQTQDGIIRIGNALHNDGCQFNDFSSLYKILTFDRGWYIGTIMQFVDFVFSEVVRIV